ncbi:MAG: hypothetical protein ABSA78_02435 [Candidatus Sulfotelmatobacter sp.]|jgi:hypothetical protein
MGAAYNVSVSSQERGPRLVHERGRGRAASRAIFFLYVLALAGVSLHLYRTPVYSMDSIQYMGNALLMEETDIVRVHQRVYAEVERDVPKAARDGLLGHEAGAPEDQNKSRQERAANPARFGEFLPLFAIRPLYNQVLWLVSKTGLGLVRAGVVISVGSYFLVGILLFVWLREYVEPGFAFAISIVLMMCPPMMVLGRDTTSDAPATLIAFLAMYLIFEKRRLAAGMALLLASIYFRTDFVVLAGPAILACWLERRMEWWKAAVLALVAVASVLCINHFAGDYGIKMLYYRNFVGVPVAPGEMTVRFSLRDYLRALRAGVTLVSESFFLPFLVLGIIGAVAKRMRALFAVTLAYVVLHFVVLPNWQERWVAIFYLSAAVCAAAAMAAIPSDTA